MAFNRLSGTIVAPNYFGPGDGPGTNIISGTLHGDGAEIIEVPRIVADPTENYMLTVGVNENSMVGEPNLRFDGSTLSLDGDLSASINISASIFYGSGAGLTDVPTAGNESVNNVAVSASMAKGFNYVSAVSSAVGVFMPHTASTSVGDVVRMKATSGVSENNSITVFSESGSNVSISIDGIQSVVMESEYGAVSFIYVSSGNWLIL